MNILKGDFGFIPCIPRIPVKCFGLGLWAKDKKKGEAP
jgi:hypothetical protein